MTRNFFAVPPLPAGHALVTRSITCYLPAATREADGETTPADLCSFRRQEQLNAARVIGVKEVRFLDREDGYLVPGLDLRKEIVREIRRERPDVLVTCDPTNLFPSVGYGINHPDHRAAGQVVLDAVFPAAGNVHFFPELIGCREFAPPHTPRSVDLSYQPAKYDPRCDRLLGDQDQGPDGT